MSNLKLAPMRFKSWEAGELSDELTEAIKSEIDANVTEALSAFIEDGSLHLSDDGERVEFLLDWPGGRLHAFESIIEMARLLVSFRSDNKGLLFDWRRHLAEALDIVDTALMDTDQET